MKIKLALMTKDKNSYFFSPTLLTLLYEDY